MLNIFRKHAQSWLIKALLIFVAAIFVWWGGTSYHSKSDTAIVQINDDFISDADYRRNYDQMLRNYRTQLGKAFSEKLIEEMNLKGQVLDMMINSYLITKAAGELGLSPSPDEIRKRILEYPVFQSEGRFDQRAYEAVLRQNDLTPEGFEKNLGEQMAYEKVSSLIKRQAVVTDEEVAADYQFNYGQIQIAYALIDPMSFEDKVTIDEQGVQGYFQNHQERYKEPEKRNFAMVVFKPETYMDQVSVSSDDIQRYYDEHRPEFQKEAQVRARQILFTVKEDASEQDVAQVRTQAEKVLAEAGKGKDFAELAKKYSQDTATARKGGDMGTVSRGQMDPELADAVFALKKGEISGLVQTDLGFQIVKVEEIIPEKTTTLEEARNGIEQTVKRQKAREIAYDKARKFLDQVYAKKDLMKSAQDQNVPVTGEGVWVSESDALPGFETPLSDIGRKLFTLSEKDFSDIFDTPQGYMIAQLQGIRPPQVPPFEKVKEKAEKDYRAERSRLLAQQKATELLDAARKSNSLEAAAKDLKLTVKNSDWFSRQQPDKELRLLRGDSVNKVFRLEEGQPFPDGPLDFGARFLVCQLLGKRPPEGGMDTVRADIVKKLTQQKQTMMWVSWLQELRGKAKIFALKKL